MPSIKKQYKANSKKSLCKSKNDTKCKKLKGCKNPNILFWIPANLKKSVKMKKSQNFPDLPFLTFSEFKYPL